MLNYLERHAPPGLDLRTELYTFIIGNGLSVLVSFLAFLDKYLDARRQLFTYENGIRERIGGAVMTPFPQLFSVYFSGFFLVALVMLGFIIHHYAYYRQGSMSQYLMKRLPRKSERHIRALTLPCLAVLATAAVAFAAILFYFMIYVLATPTACLPFVALREIGR